MANKHQVLKLLAKGKTPSQIAEQLGCKSEYVRATRARAKPGGKSKSNEYAREAYNRRREREHRA